MKSSIKNMMMEKDKMRGLVPSRAFGSRDKVFTSYLERLNPRDSAIVQQALATSTDIRYREFLDRILTNRYKRVSLATIAKACNLDYKEFSDWWNRESTAAAIAIAQNSSVDITADMAIDARSIEAACERCDGMTWISCPQGLPIETPGYRYLQSSEGEVMWIRDCPNCKGGKVRKPGDSHSRDRVLELGGLLKRGGAQVAIVQNFGGASHPSAVMELEKSMTIDISGTD